MLNYFVFSYNYVYNKVSSLIYGGDFERDGFRNSLQYEKQLEQSEQQDKQNQNRSNWNYIKQIGKGIVVFTAGAVAYLIVISFPPMMFLR